MSRWAAPRRGRRRVRLRMSRRRHTPPVRGDSKRHTVWRGGQPCRGSLPSHFPGAWGWSWTVGACPRIAGGRLGPRPCQRLPVTLSRRAFAPLALTPRRIRWLGPAADNDHRRSVRTGRFAAGADRWPFDLARIFHLASGEGPAYYSVPSDARVPAQRPAIDVLSTSAPPPLVSTAGQLSCAPLARTASVATTPRVTRLTAQQRESLESCLAGLSNSRSAQRFFFLFSFLPATSAYHLHQVFPSLRSRPAPRLRDALQVLSGSRNGDDTVPLT